ncbi:hypothetical protein K449DRAFT_469562, partial [Hypoxylon sp. EC38]
MTTIIIRIETMSTREHEVVDLTVPSREPSVEPELASSITLTGAEADSRELEHSRTLSPSREDTKKLDDRPAEGTPELPSLSATPKGKELYRSPSPVVASTSRVEIEIVGPSRVTTRTTEASSSTTVTELPTTPERAAAGSKANGSLSPRKRRLGSPEFLVIVKEEPDNWDNYDNRPPSPIENYPSMLKNEDDDDDDELAFSPKKLRGSPNIDSSPIPFGRSSAPSPRPPQAPVYHPDFPDRPALRCPKRNLEHHFIDRRSARSSRNNGREYFMCPK